VIFKTSIKSIIIILLISTFITAQNEQSVVEKHGLIKTAGNLIVDQKGKPVVLRGMSLFWSQWMPQYYNEDCVKWLRDDWKCTVVRAAMAVESGGYLTNPAAEKAKIKKVIDACIALGIYVIVDWHDHNAHKHLLPAITFFQEIASEYGTYPNIIYEIYNEPEQVSWPAVVKPYADSVVKYIREIDPDNLIIVGTPNWSQYVDLAANDPIKQNNIAYSLHFYSSTHKQWLRDRAKTAMARGAALFVTEFGTSEATGTGYLDSLETETWLKFLEDNKISWCNWSITDKNETSASLKPGASGKGGWPLSSLTKSGLMIRDKIIKGNTITVDVAREQLPNQFELYQNYPNPFNPVTTIRYSIPGTVETSYPDKSGQVMTSLRIYDLLGQEISLLVNEYKAPGVYEVQFNASNLTSGVYLYKLQFASLVQTKIMVLLK
jgi:endoglucanase